MLYNIHNLPITRGLYTGALIIGASAFVVGCGSDNTNGTSPTTNANSSQSSSTQLQGNRQPSNLESSSNQSSRRQSSESDASNTQREEQRTRSDEDSTDELNEYSYDQREKFTDIMEDHISRLNSDIDDFETTSKEANDEAQRNADRQVKALREQSSSLEDHVNEVSDSEESRWNHTRSSIVTNYTNTRASLRSARQQNGTEQPGTQRPGAQQPGVQQPGTHRPGAQQPGAHRPGAQQPGSQRPGSDRSERQQARSEQAGSQRGGTQQSGTQQGERGARGSSESTRELRAYSFDRRDAFTSTMEERISELNNEIDQLEESNRDSSEQERRLAGPRMEALRDQSSKLEEQVDAVSDAEESNWDEVKTSIVTDYNTTRNSVRMARQQSAGQQREGRQSERGQSESRQQREAQQFGTQRGQQGARSRGESDRELNAYSYEQREEFTSSMEERISVLNRDIDRLENASAASSDAAQTRARPQLQTLRTESRELENKVAQANDSEESSWDQVQSDIVERYNSTKESVHSAQQSTSSAPSR